MPLATSCAHCLPRCCCLLAVDLLKILFTIWFAFSAAAFTWLYLALPRDGTSNIDSTIFLPGQTTHGHYQIELKCSACHTPDGQVSEQSCIDCHAAALKLSRDTHPQTKFRDPAKADLLEKIDASSCITCHAEHKEDRTLPMGVTVPADFCFHCHEGVADDRPSHADMAFDTCTNAGCHNYHDNTALYENFLKKHLNEPDLLQTAAVPRRSLDPTRETVSRRQDETLTADLADAPIEFTDHATTLKWAKSSHALTGINCSGCHEQTTEKTSTQNKSSQSTASWISDLNHQSCKSCHQQEVSGFLAGKHGMRLAAGLPPMSPELARSPMHSAAAHAQLSCASCHDPHQPDLRFAAHDACLKCHDDQHTRSYQNSGHQQLWLKELSGQAAPGTGVSCATCHMPRGEDGRVQHNQNSNLQPNEKMVRTVCLNCHGMQFTLDSLADPLQKAKCYSAPPVSHVNSLEMVDQWFRSKQNKK